MVLVSELRLTNEYVELKSEMRCECECEYRINPPEEGVDNNT